jgi:predicted ATPase
MLTRLKVSGFKNLIDVDIRFGPFTCIAGANGVGKSNLFDAIRFLSALADLPLTEAALSVRDEEGKTGDIRSLFHRVGESYASYIKLVAEMIIPSTGVDDLGQKAKASITFLEYSLCLKYREDHSLRSLGSLEIVNESLERIKLNDATKKIWFPHKPNWRKSAIVGRRSPPFISTQKNSSDHLVVQIHQDQTNGRPLARLARDLPRTVLSSTNAAESPTALLARREMQSWQLLQLEPSALRKPDDFQSPTQLGADGSHLAATLYHLARNSEEESQIYSQVANRLSELTEGIRTIDIDRDDRRELLTLIVESLDGTKHPARSLSDGTLRFLALAVLEIDPYAHGVLCLEEPENGIHPERISNILNLLQDIALDPTLPVDETNPLRQVIINTHSPSVVKQVPDDSLIIAELVSISQDQKRCKVVKFSCLDKTWRHQKAKDQNEDFRIAFKGQLFDYLNPTPITKPPITEGTSVSNDKKKQKRRVLDRPDLRPFIPGFWNEKIWSDGEN